MNLTTLVVHLLLILGACEGGSVFCRVSTLMREGPTFMSSVVGKALSSWTYSCDCFVYRPQFGYKTKVWYRLNIPKITYGYVTERACYGIVPECPRLNVTTRF